MKRLLLPVSTVAIVSVLVLSVVWFARSGGHLQTLELMAYDWCVRHTTPATDAPVTVVGIDESDIQAMPTYPITDGQMAQALTTLLELGPRAIGVDIFRDKPVEPGHDAMNAVLAEHGNVVIVGRYHALPALRLQGPAVLADTGRVGFADQVLDADGVVRRALLLVQDEQMPVSLGFLLAAHYLAADGIEARNDDEHPDLMRLGRWLFRPIAPSDGAYINADAAGQQMLLDFRGPRPIRTIPWQDVISGRVDAQAVRDRVVLIGVNQTDSVKDHLPAPIDSRMPGVYLHAHAAEQLIRLATRGGPTMRWLSDRGELVWTLLWTLLGGAVAWCVRSPWRLVVAALIAAGTLSGVAWQAFDAWLWLPYVPPMLAMILSAAMTTVCIAAAEKKQRQAVSQLFARCVSPQVADEVWSRRDELLQGGRLRPQEVQATVMFTDLVGFTAMSEAMPPEEVMNRINSYMDHMTGHVLEHGGMINKYIGDAIMAVFGVPLVSRTAQEQARDARQAVRCALALRQALIAFNRDRGTALRMRVGIQSGKLVAGSIGSVQRLEYTVLGDTVNTAARLESFDKELMDDVLAPGGCRILVGGATRELLGNEFALQHVTRVQLYGKAQSLDVYAVPHYAEPGHFDEKQGKTP
jgi:adenylate cyclase